MIGGWWSVNNHGDTESMEIHGDVGGRWLEHNHGDTESIEKHRDVGGQWSENAEMKMDKIHGEIEKAQ